VEIMDRSCAAPNELRTRLRRCSQFGFPVLAIQ
jgi:hypothetical protein